MLKTVCLPTATDVVKESVVKGCVNVLRKAGVLVEGKGMGPRAWDPRPWLSGNTKRSRYRKRSRRENCSSCDVCIYET